MRRITFKRAADCWDPYTIANADLIVVVEHGRISQTGTHAQLLAEGGKYRMMVEQQIRMTLGDMTPRSLGGSEFAAFVTRVDRGDSVA